KYCDLFTTPSQMVLDEPDDRTYAGREVSWCIETCMADADGIVIVMQLDRVEDLYGDRGDRWCALARQVCKKPEAVEAFREDVVNPATPFMRAIQNELNSPAKPLIPAPWSIKRAIRRKRENTITEILVATGTPQENVELRFCLQRAADGEYTIRCTIPNRSPQTGRTVEVADLS